MPLDTLKVLSQYLVPQHVLSRAAGWLAEQPQPWLKDRLIRWFSQHYQVDLSEAELTRPEDYANFNAFFTRALAEGARTIDPDPNSLSSPVDACISQYGPLDGEQLIQAKGHHYTCSSLLGDTVLAQDFAAGDFMTLYLAPKDYHRIHMPCPGVLRHMLHIPGHLFSVNPLTASRIPGLFARNERLVCIFDTQWGPLAIVLVGAMIVGSIETPWAGVITPPTRSHVQRWAYPAQGDDALHFAKGAEIGRFRLGSTVILCLPQHSTQWQSHLDVNQDVRMGQALAQLTPPKAST